MNHAASGLMRRSNRDFANLYMRRHTGGINDDIGNIFSRQSSDPFIDLRRFFDGGDEVLEIKRKRIVDGVSHNQAMASLAICGPAKGDVSRRCRCSSVSSRNKAAIWLAD